MGNALKCSQMLSNLLRQSQPVYKGSHKFPLPQPRRKDILQPLFRLATENGNVRRTEMFGFQSSSQIMYCGEGLPDHDALAARMFLK